MKKLHVVESLYGVSLHSRGLSKEALWKYFLMQIQQALSEGVNAVHDPS